MSDVNITIGATVKDVLNKFSRVKSKANSLQKDLEGIAKFFGISKEALDGMAKAAGAASLVGYSLKKAYDFSEYGAGLLRMGEAGEGVARSMSLSYDELITKLREASHETVADSKLMLDANRAMLLGVAQDADEMAQLMEVAMFRGRAMGESTEKAFSDLVLGIGRLSPKILDNQGIVLDSQKVYTEYAESIGKSTTELTRNEKIRALTLSTIAEGNKLIEEAGGLIDDEASAYERLSAKMQNIKDAAASGLAEKMEPAMFTVETMFGVSTIQQEIDQKVRARKQALLTDSKNYEDYVRGIMRINNIASGHIGAVVPDSAVQYTVDTGGTNFEVTRSMYEALRLEALGHDEAARAAAFHGDELSTVTQEMLDAQRQAEELAEQNEIIAKNGIKLEKVTRDYNERLEDLNEQLEEEIRLHGENSDQVRGIRGEIDELTSAYQENTATFILGIMKQKGASADMQVAFAEAAGLISSSTSDILRGLDSMYEAQENGVISMEDYVKAAQVLITKFQQADGMQIDVFVNQIISTSGDDPIAGEDGIGGGFLGPPDDNGVTIMPHSADIGEDTHNEDIASASVVNIYGSVTISVQDISPAWIEAIR